MNLQKWRKSFVPAGPKAQAEKTHILQWENRMILILTMIVNIVLMSFLYDFYYDLNDDVLMKDIMAGVYTGTPEGHNMQTLYLLGALIALCYRLCRNIPWYGLFLFLCQTGSLYLIGVRLLGFCKKRVQKAGIICLITVFMWGVMLPHLVAVQYTITCSLLAGAALFLFMTTEKGLTSGRFIKRNLPSVFLVILAYQLRSEMLLLLFPLICLAGFFRWLEEEKFFGKENYYRYGIVIGTILAGLLFSSLTDAAAYAGKDWRAFRTFFNNRTTVYDFHLDVVTSGEHKEYLRSIGLGDASQELLANYNFGLDEEIDENVLGEIAAYASGDAAKTAVKNSADEWLSLFQKRVREYLYRILAAGDAPYNRLMVFGYGCVFLAGVCGLLRHKDGRGKWKFLWELILLGIVRTGLWMYILMNGRDPERITHSLYFVETMLLAGMLCMNGSCRKICCGTETGPEDVKDAALPETAHRRLQNTGMSRAAGIVFAGIVFLICLCYLPQTVRRVSADMEARETANRGAEAILEYCRAHPENFYFEDVYSTVGFSQKIFKNIDNSLGNYDIMGGWICKSPLYQEKLNRFGMETMEAGLLGNPNVYFIMDIELPDSNTDWIQAYYAQEGTAVEIEQADLIDGKYAVYRVRLR